MNFNAVFRQYGGFASDRVQYIQLIKKKGFLLKTIAVRTHDHVLIASCESYGYINHTASVPKYIRLY